MIRNAILAVILTLFAAAFAFAGPPAPVPYREIPDPPDSEQRHILVKAADRGPVWLLTGFLNNYTPQYDPDMLDALKIKHWRSGTWPFWYPSTITAKPAEKWGGVRDSAEWHGKYLDAMLRLRKQGMTWQVLLHHQGPYYDQYTHPKESLPAYRDHIYTLVKYCSHMGLPVDYWEVDNEPAPGPYEGVSGYGFSGTWQEFLDYWDTAYEAIRAADPKAKLVGPSYGIVTAATMEPFLAHCKEKGQKLDVLSWHEITQDPAAPGFVVEPDKAHKNIDAIRRLVETRYSALEVSEYHIDEWGAQISDTGPGTQIAMFYYLDLAGVDRAAKAHWTYDDLDGIMVDANTPRTSYWAWREYAAGTGVRLVTETDDRCVVAIASRDDAGKTVRALVARSRRNSGPDSAKVLPPVSAVVDFEGIPISGKAEVTILKLGPDDGPVWADDLPRLTTEKAVEVNAGRLSITLENLPENGVYSIRIAPSGTVAKEKATKAKSQTSVAAKVAPVKDQKTLHYEALRKAEKAAKSGIWRINCGATFGYTDPKGNGWFPDRVYEPGSWGHVLGGTVDRGAIEITGTDNPQIYRSELYGVSSYKLLLPRGKYRVRLHFTEAYAANLGREFDVRIGNRTVLSKFDAFKASGGMNKAIVKEFQTVVTDGGLSIDFVASNSVPPAINGIEVFRMSGRSE